MQVELAICMLQSGHVNGCKTDQVQLQKHLIACTDRALHCEVICGDM
jgi:hypothetical protein